MILRRISLLAFIKTPYEVGYFRSHGGSPEPIDNNIIRASKILVGYLAMKTLHYSYTIHYLGYESYTLHIASEHSTIVQQVILCFLVDLSTFILSITVDNSSSQVLIYGYKLVVESNVHNISSVSPLAFAFLDPGRYKISKSNSSNVLCVHAGLVS